MKQGEMVRGHAEPFLEGAEAYQALCMTVDQCVKNYECLVDDAGWRIASDKIIFGVTCISSSTIIPEFRLCYLVQLNMGELDGEAYETVHISNLEPELLNALDRSKIHLQQEKGL